MVLVGTAVALTRLRSGRSAFSQPRCDPSRVPWRLFHRPEIGSLVLCHGPRSRQEAQWNRTDGRHPCLTSDTPPWLSWFTRLRRFQQADRRVRVEALGRVHE